MKVTLSTIGKFWTFHLARQMHLRGALGAIFSGYPSIKLKDEGLPKHLVKTFPWIHAPYMQFGWRMKSLRKAWQWQDVIWFDRYVSDRLPPCDVFCGLSGSALRTGRRAKQRGAKYVCDRGSSHIRFQDQILREEYDRQGLHFRGTDPRGIVREEEEYDLADAIAVPSTFALNSFVACGVPSAKVALVPYGVELSRFFPTRNPSEKEFHVLFVGSLSVRKGLSYLLEAFEKLEHKQKRLILVGGIDLDCRRVVEQLRNRRNVSIVGHLPQSRLREIMSGSHVLVLPSIEEGFGMVQAEAMACGCPVIASTNTGASNLFEHSVEGFITPIRDADAIAENLQTLADNPQLRHRMGAAALRRTRSMGGWDQYGKEMYQTFSDLIEK